MSRWWVGKELALRTFIWDMWSFSSKDKIEEFYCATGNESALIFIAGE